MNNTTQRQIDRQTDRQIYCSALQEHVFCLMLTERTTTAPAQRSEPTLEAVSDVLATRFDAVSVMCIISTGTSSALLATYQHTTQTIPRQLKL